MEKVQYFLRIDIYTDHQLIGGMHNRFMSFGRGKSSQGKGQSRIIEGDGNGSSANFKFFFFLTVDLYPFKSH